jgi:hypothetical protein
LSVDTTHVAILRRGPRPWNAWRAQNPTTIPYLVGVSLSVSERQLGPINGGPVDLSAARMRNASLRFAGLTAASLEEADLSDADLVGARLDGASLRGTDLSRANLDRVDLGGADLAGANICGTQLREARNLTQEQLDAALGDAYTLLPQHLVKPHAWAICRDMRPDAEDVLHLRSLGRNPTPLARPVERVSWLVGGPRLIAAE